MTDHELENEAAEAVQPESASADAAQSEAAESVSATSDEAEQAPAENETADTEQPESADTDETAEAQDAEDEVDPVEEFKAKLRRQEGDWFVIHTYAGYENRVKTNLESRTSSLNMEDYIFEIEVPQEEVDEIKNGQRKRVKRNRFPGYVLVRMELTDESWSDRKSVV